MIIGITGTLGAGKGTVGEYLVQEKAFGYFSARAFIAKEVEKRGLPMNRDTFTEVANDLRATYGPGHIIRELYREAQESGGDAVIESIRTPGEIEALKKEEDFYLLAVDADPRLRYERVVERASETDRISFQKFLVDEEREMHSVDPNKQNLGACIAAADFKLINNGSLEELHTQIEEVLKEIHG